MLFYPFFRTLVEKQASVTVELKNDLCITGVLLSVDQYLNFKLGNVRVNDPETYPHLLSVKTCFLRGSVIRYVHLPTGIDTGSLQELCEKEAATAKAK